MGFYSTLEQDTGRGGWEGSAGLGRFALGSKKDGTRKCGEGEAEHSGKECKWCICAGEFDLNIGYVQGIHLERKIWARLCMFLNAWLAILATPL